MEIQFASTLRKIRKESNMTQEQLAEALGVTVGAVYKWENGRSTPEISLLIEMADLFGTSVDALLNYKVRSSDREQVVERLKAAVHQQPSEDTLMDAEKAIRRYPNHFEVIYNSARLYSVAGTTQRRQEWSVRALTLLQHAILLLDQNTDADISALSIQVQMAELYADLDERDKAVALLKSNNPMGINNAQIGKLLSINSRFDEAVPYLSKALVKSVVNQLTIADGYLNVTMKQKNYHAAIEVLNWILSSIRSLQYPGQSSFLNRLEAFYLTVLAEMDLCIGQKAEAQDTLRQAKQTALRFDADPDYSVKRLRFVTQEEAAAAFDNLGESAMAGIQAFLREEDNRELNALWEAVLHE